jgi:Tfp pilus assembly protein PilF
LKWCQQALQTEQAPADLYLNLGLVYLRAKRRDLAYRTLKRGLDVEPDHRACRDTLDRLRMRQRPVFPFLARKHPLNRYCGLVRNHILGL